MRVVGLTGGIASGKSTVARLLAQRGLPVVDADQLAREVVLPGTPALAAIAQRWPDVVRPDGTLDRAALGAKVFADANERDALEAIVLPRIVDAFRQRVRELEAQGQRCAVFDAPTLLENRLESQVDGVLLVAAPESEQVRRLLARSGGTAEEARQRIAAQMPLAEKRRRATWVLENDGPPESLPSRVDEVWRRVEAALGL